MELRVQRLVAFEQHPGQLELYPRTERMLSEVVDKLPEFPHRRAFHDFIEPRGDRRIDPLTQRLVGLREDLTQIHRYPAIAPHAQIGIDTHQVQTIGVVHPGPARSHPWRPA